MKLKEIMNIPGVGGLHKTVAKNKNGFIVESLLDGKRIPINSNQQILMLSQMAVYTSGDEMPLVDVFKKIEADGEKLAVDPKAAPEELKKYFKKLIPDIDEERVHASHMKKMLTWFEILKGKIDFNEKEEESDDAVKQDEQGKPVAKAHEGHAPKADKHAKTTTAKLRKKV